MHYTGSSPSGENKNRHKCHVCSENSPKITLQLVHFAPSQPPAFEIQSILLNDSASLRFVEHQALQPDRSQNKDWYLHLCPVWSKKTKKLFAGLQTLPHALSRVNRACLTDQLKVAETDRRRSNPKESNNFRRSSKVPDQAHSIQHRTNLPNKKLVAPTSVGATSLNAVAQGFEPWVAVTPHSISSAAPSAARTRYLGTPQ